MLLLFLEPEYGIDVYVETRQPLNLLDASRFMKRLDVATQFTLKSYGAKAEVRIDQIGIGSLKLKLKFANWKLPTGKNARAKTELALAAGALIVGIAAYFKDDPAGSTTQIFNGPVISITVSDGIKDEKITPLDVMPQSNSPRRKQSAPRFTQDPTISEIRRTGLMVLDNEIKMSGGLLSGTVRRYGSEVFAELDVQPGLMIVLRDSREAASKYLEDRSRYTFDGELHIAPRGEESFFEIFDASKH